MSRKIVVIKGCDADKSPEHNLDETLVIETLAITFAGVEYETDLCTDHAAALRADLAPHLEAAFGRKRIKAPASRSRADREANRRIRDWARTNGLQISDRGIIPDDIRAAYAEDERPKKSPAPKAAPPPPAAVAGKRDGGHTAKALAVTDPAERAAMRAFAAEQGRTLGRGFIPRDIQTAYRAAQAEAGAA